MVNKTMLSTLLISSLAANVKSATIVKGGIYFDQQWTKEGSPYELGKNAKVGPNTTVTMLPGAFLNGNGFKLSVVGNFITRGTAEEAVEITDVNLTPGKGDVGVIDMQHTRFEAGSLFGQEFHKGYKASLQLRDSKLRDIPDIFLFFPKSDCHIERNIFTATGGISSGTSGAAVIVRNNVFYMQTSDFAVKNWHRKPLIVEKKGGGRPDVFAKDMIVEYNSFLCTDRVALRMDRQYSDAEMRVAQNNYFGTSDPDAIANMIFDKTDDIYVSERIKYEPYLSRPHPDTPKTKFNMAWCAAPVEI